MWLLYDPHTLQINFQLATISSNVVIIYKIQKRLILILLDRTGACFLTL